jgi:hypothetical protein
VAATTTEPPTYRLDADRYSRIVDIPARAVEVRTDPGAAGYRTLRTMEPGEVLPSPCEGVGDLAVDELLAGV